MSSDADADAGAGSENAALEGAAETWRAAFAARGALTGMVTKPLWPLDLAATVNDRRPRLRVMLFLMSLRSVSADLRAEQPHDRSTTFCPETVAIEFPPRAFRQ
ncbi:hypothetical protein [Methylobacterium sp. C25]|uniref:hypothetical protein n=1 Tax=Methylobacterium sp. C25 TaxID=2721622 RepID=UPI001F251F85|nr:hypothetical protein [Methylobacterium sp. C25]